MRNDRFAPSGLPPIREPLASRRGVTQADLQRCFFTPLRKDLQMTTALRPSTALRQRMLQDLQLAGLSERTQEAYLRCERRSKNVARVGRKT
jgi:hypothetical protein